MIVTESGSERFAGPLRLRHPSASQTESSPKSEQEQLVALIDRWLDADSMTTLCRLLFEDLQKISPISQLLIVSRSSDMAQTWAVAPQEDQLVHAVDRILGTSPTRMDLLVGGRGRVVFGDGVHNGALGEFEAIGFSQSAVVSTETPVSFSVYCGLNRTPKTDCANTHGDSHPNCLTDSSLWPSIQIVLKNLARMEHLRALSHIDSVTGIHNRSYFNLRLVEEVARARRYQRPLSLTIFDIDYFKSLNDTYGHQTGDAILRQLAEYVRWTIRSIDVFCRLGGDEFAVLMPDADTSDCSHFAERLLSVLNTQKFALSGPGQTTRLGISMGAAVYPTHATEHERLLWCADMSLLEAKHRGRAQFLLYEEAFGRHPAAPL